ncbi:hypothetical protein [Leptospira ilyithenensis]|uniref:Lipoprotein n=1 Tax=Leptospira ilyithenensis TaxID=2484901 RepID=A0A4R9LUK0_9LEPT|nr:hypothetical protein [Leptospira ilyithenensis]TGN14193.1 hypothetical protein EHS11_02515 [Leptospira ilyithenensis]
MNRFVLICIFCIFFGCFNETLTSDDNSFESKVKIRAELGTGDQFKDFLKIIQSKNCANVTEILDTKFIFNRGGIKDIFEFKRKNKYKEKKHGFHVCDLFFDSKTMIERIAIIDQSELTQPFCKSPFELLSTSKGISIHGDDSENRKDVFVNFYSRKKGSQIDSNDAILLFSCPRGFNFKCYLRYMEQ